ncbi:MAG: hypothetical protein GX220_00665 [Treponema sp.]|nr:hypothetical protein [Treponema sp.]
MKRIVFFIFLFSNYFLFSQSSDLPHGYRNINLGMTLESVKKELLSDSVFGYRGDRDVSLLPNGYKQTIIETSNNGFLSATWFLFNENRLYNMTININRELMDYHSVFLTLCNKYGQPEFLNPEKAIWQNEWIQMTLERPLSIKYMDMIVFNSLQEESGVDQSVREMLREDFLDSL